MIREIGRPDESCGERAVEDDGQPSSAATIALYLPLHGAAGGQVNVLVM